MTYQLAVSINDFAFYQILLVFVVIVALVTIVTKVDC